MVAVGLVICILIGGFIRAYQGYLTSGEPFEKKKFITSLIATGMGCLVVASIQLSNDLIFTGWGGWMGQIITWLLTGYGAAEAKTQASKVLDKVKGV